MFPPLGLAALAAAAQALLTRESAPTRVSLAASVLLTAPSVLLLGATASEFRASMTTIDPRSGAEPGSLVTTGANAWSRNPMYVGMAGLLLAHACARRSALAIAPTALFITWIDRVQIPDEERRLRRRFGAEFEAYSQRVRRWL